MINHVLPILAAALLLGGGLERGGRLGSLSETPVTESGTLNE